MIANENNILPDALRKDLIRRTSYISEADRDTRAAFVDELARAAIEADRARQGNSAKVLAELAALIPLADTLNASASCQDLIGYFKGVIADRKRRGKPVGWQPIETAPHGEEVLLGWLEWDGAWKTEVSPASWGWSTKTASNISMHGQATHWMPIPPAPQPAEPVKTDSAGYTLGPVSDGGMDPRNAPAEPVKVPADTSKSSPEIDASAQRVDAPDDWQDFPR